MEELRLVLPTEEYAGEIAAYRQEMLDASGSMDGTQGLRGEPDPLRWIESCRRWQRGEGVPPDRVPATEYLFVRLPEGRVVGMLNLRHYLTEETARYAGHIGYSVRPAERRKGYAKAMLRAALPRARELGLTRVMVSCLAENEPSRRTILACGGRYDATVPVASAGVLVERYWVPTGEENGL